MTDRPSGVSGLTDHDLDAARQAMQRLYTAMQQALTTYQRDNSDQSLKQAMEHYQDACNQLHFS